MKLLQVLIEYNASKLDRPFSYAYLEDEEIQKGIRVQVNFNNRSTIGYVLDVTEIDTTLEEYNKDKAFEIKEIEKIIDTSPLLNNELQEVGKLIASYYHSSLISVYQAMLPPSLKPKSSSLKGPKIKYEAYLEINKELEEILTPKQLEIYYIVKNNQPIKKSEIKSSVVNTLINKHYLKVVNKEVNRLEIKEYIKKESITLNEEQSACLNSLLYDEDKNYLLQGITGSGKTEIYIEATKYYLKEGKQVLILVPEISLTYQMVRRFKEQFDNIAILHSGLTNAEKYDEYRRISKGEVPIVIGTRSASFAPLNNLGLVIIDEEHSETYKQDTSPYYSALKVLTFRQRYQDFKILLGSATPNLVTKAKAIKGYFHQLYLTKRYYDVEDPDYKIIDMRDYHNIDSESTIFSLTLREKIKECLDKKEQVMLLINRRGYAPYIQCKNCNAVFNCPTCKIPLTYHKQDDLLKCHHCGYTVKMLEKCPKCESKQLYKLGFGTQRVEVEINKLFEGAKVLRLDSDTSYAKSQQERIIEQFNNQEADILVGTQIISKGHDFKNVTLVGIVLADLGLNLPSFNSSERTFDLISQTVGRVGRAKKGTAIIQTYNPDHYAIYYGSKQAYNSFFKQEMQYRKMKKDPPYYNLALVQVSSSNENDLIDYCATIKNYFISEFKDKNVLVIGPSEPFIKFSNNRYQRKILLKFFSYKDIDEPINRLIEGVKEKSDIKISVNIDPNDDY